MENKFYIIIGVVASLFAIVGHLTGFFRWAFGQAKKVFGTKGSVIYKIPRKTIVLIPKPHKHSCWWHMGSSGGEPSMQVVGKYTVTNITKYNILLTVAKMKEPKLLGHVHTKDVKSQYHGSYAIPKGHSTEMGFHFWIMPPVREKGEPFRADIAILDQFGNEHWLKGVEFQYS